MNEYNMRGNALTIIIYVLVDIFNYKSTLNHTMMSEYF